MLWSFIEMGEYCSRLVRDNRYFVILSGKLTDSFQRIKPHNRNEFNFFSDFAAKQLNTFEATNVPILNTDEDQFDIDDFIKSVRGDWKSVLVGFDFRHLIVFVSKLRS